MQKARNTIAKATRRANTVRSRSPYPWRKRSKPRSKWCCKAMSGRKHRKTIDERGWEPCLGLIGGLDPKAKDWSLPGLSGQGLPKRPHLAPVWKRDADSRNADKPDSYLVECKVIDFLLGQRRAADAVLQDRDGGSAVLNNQGRGRSRRELAQNGLRYGRDLRYALHWGNALMQKNLDDPHAS